MSNQNNNSNDKNEVNKRLKLKNLSYNYEDSKSLSSYIILEFSKIY